MFDVSTTQPERAAPAGDPSVRPRLRVTTARPAISVVGLGYVGAVSCGCLADLGHCVVGVDVDADRIAAIAAGRSPMHEEGLDKLLAAGVSAGRLDATHDLQEAVAGTDVTLVAVGTPTAADGSCDTSHIEAVAEGLGRALAAKAGFHVVMLRCSVPPGTTTATLGRIVEQVSGRAMGVDFGLAFVPEFLREGMAVEDFRAPPKTVIGASDPRTADIVARIFDGLGPAPLRVGIETAELVKYVDNVWHATKVCFANEVGRLARSAGIDGREVMDVFVQDTKLNLSPYYLKPGFAYGGSCLPKEVRAVNRMAARHGVDLPMVRALPASNGAQIAEAVRLVRATGARRVGVLGLAFKAGTDDLRESPILEVMATLMDDGATLIAHDPIIGPRTRISAQLAYVRHGARGLHRLAACLPDLLAPRAEDVLADAEAVIVTQDVPLYRRLLQDSPVPVIDVARALPGQAAAPGSAGIGW